MEFLAWLVLGLIAGAIAKLIYPGRQGGGIFATILLGIIGAWIGGFIGRLLFGASAAAAGTLSIPSIISAIVGAIILIFLWGLVTRRTA